MDDANGTTGQPEYPGEPSDAAGASEARTPRHEFQSRGEQIRLWIVTLTPITTTVSTVIVTFLAR